MKTGLTKLTEFPAQKNPENPVHPVSKFIRFLLSRWNGWRIARLERANALLALKTAAAHAALEHSPLASKNISQLGKLARKNPEAAKAELSRRLYLGKLRAASAGRTLQRKALA